MPTTQNCSITLSNGGLAKVVTFNGAGISFYSFSPGTSGPAGTVTWDVIQTGASGGKVLTTGGIVDPGLGYKTGPATFRYVAGTTLYTYGGIISAGDVTNGTPIVYAYNTDFTISYTKVTTYQPVPPFTVYYSGYTGVYPGTPYPRTTTPPSKAGSYTVEIIVDYTYRYTQFLTQKSIYYYDYKTQTLVISEATLDIAAAPADVTTAYNGTVKSLGSFTTPLYYGQTVTTTNRYYQSGAIFTDVTPINAGTYYGSAISTNPNFLINQTLANKATLTINKRPIAISVSNQTNQYNGSIIPYTSYTLTPSIPAVLNYRLQNGNVYSTTAPTNAEKYVVDVTPLDTENNTGFAQGYLEITKAPVFIQASDSQNTYNGQALPYTSYTTDPSPLPVAIRYRLSSSSDIATTTSPIVPGEYVVEVTPANDNYSGSDEAKYTILKATSTLTFNPISTKKYGSPAFTLVASSTSGTPVTFTTGNTSVATITGNLANITNVGPGYVFITAKEGNPYYQASDIVQKVIVDKADQALTIVTPTNINTRTIPFQIVANSSSGLPLSYSLVQGPALLTSSGVLSVLGYGPVTVRVTQVGSANFNSVTDTISFLIEGFVQTFTEGVSTYFGTANKDQACPIPIAQDFLLCEPTPGVWPSLRNTISGSWDRVELWWEYVKKTENW